jgi:hypothetical protein
MKSLIALLALLVGCSSSNLSSEFDAEAPKPDTSIVDATIDLVKITDAGPSDSRAPDIQPVDAYGDAAREFVSSDISVVGEVDIVSGDNAWVGSSLMTSEISGIVIGQLDNEHLPYDENGIYFVLTGPNVFISDPSNGDGLASGYCSSWCGWHDSIWTKVNGTDQLVHYGMVGNPDNPSCNTYGPGVNACSGFDTGIDGGAMPPTPNGDWVADSMITVLCHETAESATDPNPSGADDMKFSWITMPDDAGGFDEISDKCSWSWGDVYGGEDGAWYNAGFGGRRYLIQQNWVLNGNNHCAMDLTGNPGFNVAEAGPPIMLVSNPNILQPILYFGGRVMTAPIHVYIVWYGWPTPNPSAEVITTMFNSLGDSEWWGIAREYFALTDGGTMMPEAGTNDASKEASKETGSND